MNSPSNLQNQTPLSETIRLGQFVQTRLPALCAQPRLAGGGGQKNLPDATLSLLSEVVGELKIERVFEFGSGRSTKRMLQSGCSVAALEQNDEWLARMLKTLSSEERSRLGAWCRPLEKVFDRGAPLKGWKLDSELQSALDDAQLIVIDSPVWPSWREHSLIHSLKSNRNGLIMVTDAADTTVQRFCRRLAIRNLLVHFHTRLDHGLFFVLPPENPASLLTGRGIWETLRTWARYYLGPRNH